MEKPTDKKLAGSIHFRPTRASKAVLQRAIRKTGKPITFLVNAALFEHYKQYAGKRELNENPQQ